MKIYECENGHLNFNYDGYDMECFECESTTFHRVMDIKRLKHAAEEYKSKGDKERKHQCADAVLLLLAEKADPSINEWHDKYGGGWYS